MTYAFLRSFVATTRFHRRCESVSFMCPLHRLGAFPRLSQCIINYNMSVYNIYINVCLWLSPYTLTSNIVHVSTVRVLIIVVLYTTHTWRRFVFFVHFLPAVGWSEAVGSDDFGFSFSSFFFFFIDYGRSARPRVRPETIGVVVSVIL